MPEKYRAVPWDILQHLFKTEKINNHVLHFSGTFSPVPDFSRLNHAVQLLADAFPLVRCNLVMSSIHPYWADKGYTAEDILQCIETKEIRKQWQRVMLQEIDPETGPQMKLALLKTEGTALLCGIINHMVCDAAGFKELLYRLCFLYTGLEKGNHIPNPSMIKSRTVGQVFRTFPLKKRIGILRHRGNLNTGGNLSFTLEGDNDSPFIEIRKIPGARFSAIKNYARLQGATVNDVVMTAYIRALSGIFGKMDIIPCALDIRRFLPTGQTAGICNLVTNIPCNTGVCLPGSFKDTLSQVKNCMDGHKNDPCSMKNLILMEYLFTALPCFIAIPVLKKLFHNPPIAFTNIGILDTQKLSLGSSKMTEGFMTGSIKYRNYVQVSLSTFADEAVFCVNQYGTQTDRKTVASLLDAIIAELDGNGIEHSF